MALHPDAVAQEGSAAEGAGGIDGYDADALVLGAEVAGELVDDGALAGAGRAR